MVVVTEVPTASAFVPATPALTVFFIEEIVLFFDSNF